LIIVLNNDVVDRRSATIRLSATIVIARSDFASFFFFVAFTASQRKPLNRFPNLEDAGKEEKERKKDTLYNSR